jgi:hypothetical protein
MEASRSSTEPRMPSLTEKAEDQLEKQVASLRLKHVLDVFKNRRRTTPKQLGRLLRIESNTPCEHLRTNTSHRPRAHKYWPLRGAHFGCQKSLNG